MLPFLIFVVFIFFFYVLMRIAIALGLAFIIVALALLFAMNSSRADVLENCQAIGQITESIAADKNFGIPFHVEELALHNAAKGAIDPGRILNVQSVYTSALLEVYRGIHPTDSPEWLGEERFNRCMRAYGF